MNRRKGIAVLGVIIALVCCIAGYFYYRHTPTYTLHLIQESVQKHDWDTFSKHVDTKNLVGTSFDAIVKVSLEDETADDDLSAIAGNFIQMMKPGIVNALDQDIEQWVKTGNLDNENKQNNKTANSKQANSNDAARNISKDVNVNKMTFKDVGTVTKHDDGTADIDIHITDNQLQQDFTLTLRMRQLDDGTWQVMAITNLEDYLKKDKQAREEKLAEINKPLQEEIDKRIALQTPTGNVVSNDPWGFSSVLRVSATAAINSDDKPISKVAGVIRIENGKGKVSETKFEAPITTNNGNQPIVQDKKLNPFFKMDKSIIKHGLDGYQLKLQVQKIEFQDGSTLELKQSLDDKDDK